MVQRHYSSNARETTLLVPITDSDTSIQVDSPLGYPVTTPFLIHCELGSSNEEIMLVTNVAGNVWDVTRGYDSSSALSHSVGAKVVHGVAAIDFKDAADHINATGNVHGLGSLSNVVGTTDTQTLTSKTLTSPSIAGGTLSGSFSGNLTTSGNVSAVDVTASGALKVGSVSLSPLAGAWTSWSPSWTGSTTNPAIGNGTLTGTYLQVGKTVFFDIVMVAGTTTTYGSGEFQFSLPVEAKNGFAATVSLRGGSPLNSVAGSADCRSGNPATAILHIGSSSGPVTSSVPWTWLQNTNQAIKVSGVYEAL
jgi:hypothetical protein